MRGEVTGGRGWWGARRGGRRGSGAAAAVNRRRCHPQTSTTDFCHAAICHAAICHRHHHLPSATAICHQPPSATRTASSRRRSCTHRQRRRHAVGAGLRPPPSACVYLYGTLGVKVRCDEADPDAITPGCMHRADLELGGGISCARARRGGTARAAAGHAAVRRTLLLPLDAD